MHSTIFINIMFDQRIKNRLNKIAINIKKMAFVWINGIIFIEPAASKSLNYFLQRPLLSLRAWFSSSLNSFKYLK